MDLSKVIHCLNSETRRKIVKILSKGDLSAPEIFNKLGNSRPRYRQSVNKSLEILKSCDLIEKYYDDNKKILLYHLKYKNISVDLEKMEIKEKKE